MPPLMRLTDSEVEVADGVVPQVSDGIEDGRDVLEKVSSGRLLIQQETLLSDLPSALTRSDPVLLMEMDSATAREWAGELIRGTLGGKHS